MKSFIDHLTEDNEHYDKAEKSKHNAELAKGQARPFDHHMHMADHHDHMSQWHASKGRHGEADRHAQKSDEHHEKAMTVKEETELDEAVGHTIEAHGIKGAKGTPWRKTFKSHDHLHDWTEKNDSVEVHATRDLESSKKKTNEEVELDEATPYYNKPSFLKKMGNAAKQERLAREKKEKEAKEVKESVDDNRTGFTKKNREDDEYHNEPKPKFKAKSLKDRPHTVHVDGKPWKKFSNGHQAETAAKTLRAKGKKATAIAHFKEHLDEVRMTAAMKLQKAFQREQEKRESEKKAGEEFMKKKTNEEAERCQLCGEAPCECDDSHGFVEGLKPEHKMRPGWMLKADPKLAKKVADNKKKFKSFKDTVGKKTD